MSNFGSNLYNLRKKNGYSQEELANKLNVTRQTISKWELEQTTPALKDLENISKTFGISLNELVLNEPENLSSKKINSKNNYKFNIKILLIIILVFILVLLLYRIYFILSIKKTIDSACWSNNFVIKKEKIIEKNFNQTVSESSELLFLDGKIKLIKQSPTNLSQIETIELINNNVYYNINEQDKTYYQLSENEYYNKELDFNVPINKDNILNEIYAKSYLSDNIELFNLLFNFNFKIENEFNGYFSISNKTNRLDNFIILQATSNKFQYTNRILQNLDDNLYNIYSYDVQLDIVKDKDFDLPNLLEYQKIDI